jgi:hypothetical protein
MDANTLQSLREKDGSLPKYAWPGGYPVFYLMNDGETLCPDCANDKGNPIHFDGLADGWRIEAADINWEDPQMFCCHCGKRIESAYAEED